MTAGPERIISRNAPDPLGAYSHAVRAAGLVFCSGQGARDPADDGKPPAVKPEMSRRSTP